MQALSKMFKIATLAFVIGILALFAGLTVPAEAAGAMSGETLCSSLGIFYMQVTTAEKKVFVYCLLPEPPLEPLDASSEQDLVQTFWFYAENNPHMPPVTVVEVLGIRDPEAIKHIRLYDAGRPNVKVGLSRGQTLRQAMDGLVVSALHEIPDTAERKKKFALYRESMRSQAP